MKTKEIKPEVNLEHIALPTVSGAMAMRWMCGNTTVCRVQRSGDWNKCEICGQVVHFDTPEAKKRQLEYYFAYSGGSRGYRLINHKEYDSKYTPGGLK